MALYKCFKIKFTVCNCTNLQVNFSFSGADSSSQPTRDEYTEGLSHRGVGQAGDRRRLADNRLRDRTS